MPYFWQLAIGYVDSYAKIFLILKTPQPVLPYYYELLGQKKSENSELGIRENMRWAAHISMYYFKALNYPRYALKLQAESQSKASKQWPHVFVYCLRHLLAKFCRKRKMLDE